MPAESADIALVLSSAYFYTKDEDEALALLTQLNKILKKTGEQRIYPVRFGFIVKKLLEENQNFFNSKSKAPQVRSNQDLKTIQFYENLADRQTVDFLKEKNIVYTKKSILEPDYQTNFNEYLIIPKF